MIALEDKLMQMISFMKKMGYVKAGWQQAIDSEMKYENKVKLRLAGRLKQGGNKTGANQRRDRL